ncbi:CapA family protein [Cellulomonas gilvus]|uniref:Capsule synthesis protein, CapA n=1 Tax=Cellulomonas gilvus (strain ATCC 13127 / NRRL B-14078) TaxID=593907 RepID=F7ZZR3_CELGA|nr:CapA family protein [Cellulomonas gilvus]AEI12556.1 Capsule synthesis protein, CapA [Cellulomonas gilvus ATCC 13127]
MTRHARAHTRSPLLAGLLTLVLILACVGGAVAALRPWERDAATPPDAAPTTPARSTSPTPTPSPTPDPDAEMTIVAAGDVLPHLPVIASATRGGRVDFGPLLAPMAPWVEGADLALCHLEVPVAPPGSRPSGYPVFASPVEIAQGLADNGWDGCSTASNHSVDKGFAGVAATLDALDAAGLGHVGTARTEQEAARPQLYRLERAGQEVTVAHIAATYGTNGMPVDADKPWSVTRIDVPAMVAQAKQARADGADVVVASVHCCTEYQTPPTAEQEQVAQQLADSGEIDLYIGHHAHVPQPIVHLDGGPDGSGMWVAYGLGNFLSNQDGDCCTPKTDSGVLLTAHLSSPGAFAADGREAGPVRVTGVEWTPITVDRLGGHVVHALTDVVDGAGTLSARDAEQRTGRVTEAVGTAAPLRRTPGEPTGPAPEVVGRPNG